MSNIGSDSRIKLNTSKNEKNLQKCDTEVKVLLRRDQGIEENRRFSEIYQKQITNGLKNILHETQNGQSDEGKFENENEIKHEKENNSIDEESCEVCSLAEIEEIIGASRQPHIEDIKSRVSLQSTGSISTNLCGYYTDLGHFTDTPSFEEIYRSEVSSDDLPDIHVWKLKNLENNKQKENLKKWHKNALKEYDQDSISNSESGEIESASKSKIDEFTNEDDKENSKNMTQISKKEDIKQKIDENTMFVDHSSQQNNELKSKMNSKIKVNNSTDQIESSIDSDQNKTLGDFFTAVKPPIEKKISKSKTYINNLDKRLIETKSMKFENDAKEEISKERENINSHSSHNTRKIELHSKYNSPIYGLSIQNSSISGLSSSHSFDISESTAKEHVINSLKEKIKNKIINQESNTHFNSFSIEKQTAKKLHGKFKNLIGRNVIDGNKNIQLFIDEESTTNSEQTKDDKINDFSVNVHNFEITLNFQKNEELRKLGQEETIVNDIPEHHDVRIFNLNENEECINENDQKEEIEEESKIEENKDDQKEESDLSNCLTVVSLKNNKKEIIENDDLKENYEENCVNHEIEEINNSDKSDEFLPVNDSHEPKLIDYRILDENKKNDLKNKLEYLEGSEIKYIEVPESAGKIFSLYEPYYEYNFNKLFDQFHIEECESLKEFGNANIIGKLSFRKESSFYNFNWVKVSERTLFCYKSEFSYVRKSEQDFLSPNLKEKFHQIDFSINLLNTKIFLNKIEAFKLKNTLNYMKCQNTYKMIEITNYHINDLGRVHDDLYTVQISNFSNNEQFQINSLTFVLENNDLKYYFQTESEKCFLNWISCIYMRIHDLKGFI